MSMNKLSINNNTISFLGFDLLKKCVTFCLYPSGIAIVPGWQPNSNPCYYKSRINDNREIEDEFLALLLNERGLSKNEIFVKAGNHYLELTPHKSSEC